MGQNASSSPGGKKKGGGRILSYLQEFVFAREPAWSHGRSGGSTCHMPSRTRSNRTCTCAQFLHIFFSVSCAAGRQEWGQMNKPE